MEYEKIVKALRFCDGGECDGCCEYKQEHGCMTLLRDAADAIEELSTVVNGYRSRMRHGPVPGEWVPVTEGLPEMYVPVLICTDDDSRALEAVRVDSDKDTDGNVFYAEALRVHRKAKAWMPMPETMKE